MNKLLKHKGTIGISASATAGYNPHNESVGMWPGANSPAKGISHEMKNSSGYPLYAKEFNIPGDVPIS